MPSAAAIVTKALNILPRDLSKIGVVDMHLFRRSATPHKLSGLSGHRARGTRDTRPIACPQVVAKRSLPLNVLVKTSSPEHLSRRIEFIEGGRSGRAPRGSYLASRKSWRGSAMPPMVRGSGAGEGGSGHEWRDAAVPLVSLSNCGFRNDQILIEGFENDAERRQIDESNGTSV